MTTKIRLTANLVMEDSPENRGKLTAIWNQIINPSNIDDWTFIIKTEEDTTSGLHECGHDNIPTTPCILKKHLQRNTIIQDDPF